MHVLLVCPPGADRDVYEATLNDGGMRPTTTNDAGRAWTCLAGADPPDIVVTDLMPAAATPWAFVEDVRRAFASIPVIIFTARVRPDGANRRRARELGCAAFVAKPCAPAQLLDVMRRIAKGERGLEVTSYST